VDQQGKIARVLVDEGIPGSELEGAAISAVLRWRFRPATEDGVPVKAWTTVRFVFAD
jgi:TonB family protein